MIAIFFPFSSMAKKQKKNWNHKKWKTKRKEEYVYFMISYLFIASMLYKIELKETQLYSNWDGFIASV